MQLCSLRDFDTFGNLARTYAVHRDGAAFDVKTADHGGGVNQNICNLGVMRDGRPIKTESGVVDNWSVPAKTDKEVYFEMSEPWQNGRFRELRRKLPEWRNFNEPEWWKCVLEQWLKLWARRMRRFKMEVGSSEEQVLSPACVYLCFYHRSSLFKRLRRWIQQVTCERA